MTDDEELSLSSIARQLDLVVSELRGWREDMSVLIAIALRLDGNLAALLHRPKE